MAKGKVKWFNNAKGYGFVLPEDGGEDLFIHYSAIQMDGYKTLKAGQDIQFEIVEGPKGLHAVNIQDVEGGEIASDQADGSEDAGLGVSVDLELEDNTPEITSSTPDASSA